MKTLSAAAITALLPCALHAATITSAELQRPEGTRHYLLAQPQQPTSGKRPLVLLLHGHLGSANLVFGRGRLRDPFQQWLAIADRDQVLVIAPDGVKGSDNRTGWNDCRADATTSPKTDDVGFLSALIDKAIAEHNADPSRIYVMGMSNGGGMTYRLGVEIGQRLAGIAAVAAVWPAKSLCPAPQTPLPLMVIHGTADRIVPYGGGEIGGRTLHGRGTSLSVEQTLALWRKLDQLPDAATQDAALAHRKESGDTSAHRYVWGSDPHGPQVELIRVDKGGHTVPSIQYRMQWIADFLLGAQNADFESAEEAWRFFRDKHRN